MLELIVEDLPAEQGGWPSFSTSWINAFSHTDYARLNLARVLVCNPEVLVMHKPTVDFDDRERLELIKLLREHVDEKGIELPAQSSATRRLRTVFFTSSSTAGVNNADAVFKVSLKDGVHPIPKENVSEGMLI